MQVSRSGYYQWRATGNVSKDKETVLEARATKLFYEHKQIVGSRRLSALLKQEGFNVGRFKTRSLMKKLHLIARCPKRYPVVKKEAVRGKVENLVNRMFTVELPNTVWTTDITYLNTPRGWMYLAVVIELYSRLIVGYAIATHMEASLCVEALRMAYWRRKPAKGVIIHSDQGSQFTSHAFRQEASKYGMKNSYSRVGCCEDNAPTERFFRSLKHEHLCYKKVSNHDDMRLAVTDYLAYYNSKRPHSKLGYLAPLEFESSRQHAILLAA